MSATWKTVRVFISSTFRDMQSERDWLVRFVFPKLRQELLQRRIHLVDVDLRWGVTSEQDALSVCREVVDECRPRFLCMLGGRYGWVPPGKMRSITGDEVHYGVLDRDLKNRGFAYFYFREPSATAAMVEATPGEFREPAGSHGAVALAELKTAITKAGLQPFIYRAQWDDQSRRLIGLKEFGDRVYADLKQSIDQEFGPTTGEKPDEFTEENAAMEAFIEERVQRFVLGSRESVLNELLAHANSTGGNGYVCLTGVSGSGKSALLAHLYRHLKDSIHPSSFIPHPCLVIPHFVGASPGSTDVRRTLRRLCHELVTGAALTAEIPEDPEKLRVAFAEILQQAAAQKRVVILLDAINQFDPTTQFAGWSWLPQELPATARIFLSVISDQSSVTSDRQTVQSPKSKVQSPLDTLRPRRTPPKEIELQPLTAEDAEAIIREFLHRYRKSMTDGQRAALLAKTDAGTPLYLLVALEELRTLGTYEEITDRIAQLPPDTRALFIWILKRLEDDDGFREASGRKIGRELASRFVSLLGASRHGLSQQELVDLLSPGDPQGNVAALAQLLRPYLMQRGELLDFYHGQFREATATSYLPSESQRLAAHDQLATYFRDKADPEKNQSWKSNSPRPFLEVVFHLVGAERSDDYCQTLCDLRFVEARCRFGQVFELIADYRLAQENLPEAQADLREERARDERMCRWTAEITEYARQWSDRRNRVSRGETITEPEPVLPEIIPSVEAWSNEWIEAECQRIVSNPTRLDRLRAFAGFVKAGCYPLLEFGRHDGFVIQHAFNTAPAGPVHTAADHLRSSVHAPLMLRHWTVNATCNPRPALMRTLQGHSEGIWSVSVASDGRRAVSGGSDKVLMVWDLASGVCLRTLVGHSAVVTCVSVTADGRRAVSGSWDKTLRVWDLESGQCLRILGGHKHWVLSVSVTPDGHRAVSGDWGTTLRVWDLESGQCLRILEGHTGSVKGVSVTPDGQRVVSGSGICEGIDDSYEMCSDTTLRIWDLGSGACLQVLEGHLDGVNSVSVTPDGHRVVSGSSDGTVRLWELETGTCLRVFKGHTALVTSVSVTPDGRCAVSGSRDNSLRVWNLESGQCLNILEGHCHSVNSLSVMPDGRRVVSGSFDATVRLWNLETNAAPHTWERHSDTVSSLSVTPNGLRAVSGSNDSALRVWDLVSGVCLRVIGIHRGWIGDLAVTFDGRCVVAGGSGMCGDESKNMRVWDLESGACLHTLRGHKENVTCVKVAPNGRIAVSGSRDRTLRVWDLESGACLRILQGHSGSIEAVALLPDGRRAISRSGETWNGGDRTVRVWDLERGQCLYVLEGSKASIGSMCVVPDSRSAVLGSCDNTVQLWDPGNGEVLRVLKGHTDSVHCVGVTPDGRRAVSGSYDKTIRVWDLENGTCLRILKGHSHWLRFAMVTSDGRRVLSSGIYDETLRVWDLESGECIAVFSAPAHIDRFVVTSSGLIACGTASGEVIIQEPSGMEMGPAICTAVRDPDSSAPLTTHCACCGRVIPVPRPAAEAILGCTAQLRPNQSPCLDLPAAAFADPCLLASCPHCSRPLQFNPFFIAADDYAEVLRRGLEQSRREKGADHEETLAHLAALAVHLETAGKSVEAAALKREHDELAAQVEAKKKEMTS